MIRIDDPAKLGPVLGDLRIMARLSQRALAERGRLRQGQISAIELSKLLPNTASLFRLAGALGYDLALIPRADDQPSNLPDLSGIRLADLDTTRIDPGAVAGLVDKACRPGASISGYNPQRLEDGE